MKLSLLILTALTASTPCFASSLMEEIKCESVPDASLQFSISTVNRPDFDLSKYNSKDAANDDGITLNVTKNGKDLDAQVITYALEGGVTQNLTDTGSDGNACVYGTVTKGIRVSAQITINGQQQIVGLRCSDELDGPHGGECN